MTVQPATKMWSKTGGSYESQDQRNKKLALTEGWQIIHDPTDSPLDILLATDLPQLGWIFPGTSNVRVVVQTPEQVSPVFTIVTIGYEGEVGPANFADDPTNTPLTFSWGRVSTEEATDQDNDGKPIVTVNNEPIEGVMRTLSDLLLIIDQNYLTVDIAATQAYLHSVNSDLFPAGAPFPPFAIGTTRMVDFGAELVTDENVAFGNGYFKVHVEFQFRFPYQTTADKTWHSRVLHQGWKVKNAATLKVIDVRDQDKNTSSRPLLLKADGTEETNPANANWLEFPIFAPLAYNSLGFRWP